MFMTRKIGTLLARYFSEPSNQLNLQATSLNDLAVSLRKGDVLLVEGTSRISTIKYLTQSSWSHAALLLERCFTLNIQWHAVLSKHIDTRIQCDTASQMVFQRLPVR